jgi:hypothetical protein
MTDRDAHEVWFEEEYPQTYIDSRDGQWDAEVIFAHSHVAWGEATSRAEDKGS